MVRRSQYALLRYDAPSFLHHEAPYSEEEAIPMTGGHVEIPGSPICSEHHDTGGSNRSRRLVTFAVAAVILSTALSIILFALSLSPRSYSSVLGTQNADSSVMLRPNSYVHLDAILAQTSNAHIKPLFNFPPYVFQTDTSDRLRTLREDFKEDPSPIGTVYRDYRHVIITESTSTVMQFRNLDYAMERCVLVVDIPTTTTNDTRDVSTTLTDHNRVHVWLLNTQNEFWGPHGQLLHRAPKRVHLLATLALGTSRTGMFPCPSGGLTTIELSCALLPGMERCGVDFWQDRRIKPRKGVYILQYPGSPAE